jgi:hypothetical protein
MNRLFATIPAAILALAPAAGCNKESKDAPATAPGAGPAGTSAQPAATAAGEAAPAAGSYTVDQACDKMAAVIESMTAAVDTNKGNCDAMGAALKKAVDDNRDFLDWAKKEDKDESKKKEYHDKCEPKLKPVAEKMGTSMAGAGDCANNESVKAALASFE